MSYCRAVRRIAGFVAVTLLLSSCSNVPSPARTRVLLVGFWEAPTESEGHHHRKQAEFRPDGTYYGKTLGRLPERGGDRTFTGSWAIDGSDLLYLKTTSSDGVLQSVDIRDRLIRVSKDSFTYTNRFGETGTYTRIASLSP